MTKRWSSTRSLDGNTKRSASKKTRVKQKGILSEEITETMRVAVNTRAAPPKQGKEQP